MMSSVRGSHQETMWRTRNGEQCKELAPEDNVKNPQRRPCGEPAMASSVRSWHQETMWRIRNDEQCKELAPGINVKNLQR
ncbi:hypothetical protein NDU88_000499 [Pleurodeles waltl]|uniref:Uncharacterized protein n=1 Tax=Pleurodeles waltl TaxID=8319 RepID=A0AAV7LWN6_PLEWA|nr:hypothetical protein NDU88_000499 [Pleurodeles waltl]